MKGFNYKPFVVIAILLVAWEASLGYAKLVSDTLAPPSAVAVAFVQALFDGTVLRASLQTLAAMLLGLLLGCGLGIVIGILSGLMGPLAKWIRAPVEVLRPLPAIALVPLMTIIFGLGLMMEVYVVAFAVIWPSIILSQNAVRNVETQLLQVADALELGYLARIWKIILPATLPRLVVLMRFTGAIALLIAVTVELVADPRGLGNEMMVASEAFVPARMLALLVTITVLGWLLNWSLLTAERYFLARSGLLAK